MRSPGAVEGGRSDAVLRSGNGGAFSDVLGVSERLETAPLLLTTPVNPLLALTRGLASAVPAGGAAPGAPPQHAPPAAERLTLPDGRLSVGTHLPLLARRYRYLSTLGEGASAQVILAEDSLAPAPGRLIAIKVMRRQHLAAGQREARALRFLHAAAPGGTAPGVVRLLGTFSLGAHYCLALERLYPRLLDWVAQSASAPRADALRALRKLAHQLLLAVACLHNRGVVHADIKPDNLLLCSPPGSPRLALRLADLGSAFSLTGTDTAAVAGEVQALPYRAPEAALGLPYGAAIDLWSVGVVIAELALRRALLPAASPHELLHGQAALLGPPPAAMVAASPFGPHLGLPSAAAPGDTAAAAARTEAAAGADRGGAARAAPAPCQLAAELAGVDAQLAHLVLGLLRYDPAYRLTAHQALLHPFFDPLCPLRAAFPQLTELCAEQQAALQAQAYCDRSPQPGEQAADAAATSARAEGKQRRQQRPLQPAPLSLAAVAEAEAAEAVAAAAAMPSPEGQLRRPAGQPEDTAAGARGRHVQQQQQQQPEPSEAASCRLQDRLQASRDPRRQPEAQRPPPQLAAARLAARLAEEMRRLAAAQPYAGRFSLDATPAKEEPHQSVGRPLAAAAAAEQRQAQQEQREGRQRQQQAEAPPPPASQDGVGAAAATATRAAGTEGPAAAGGQEAARTEAAATPAAAAAPAAVATATTEAGRDVRGSLDLLMEAAAGEMEGRERQHRRQQAQRRGTPAAKPARSRQGAGRATPATAVAARPKQSAQGRPRQQSQPDVGGSPAQRTQRGTSLQTKTPSKRQPSTERPAAAFRPAASSPVQEPPAAEGKRKRAATAAQSPGPDTGREPPATVQKAERAAAVASPEADASQPPATAAKRARREHAGQVPWWVVQG